MPDPLRAARLAIDAGADSITAHLREDRRHIRDEDMRRLKRDITKPLNFEMAATDEMVAIALDTRPHASCLVPEKRSERTTEGGLDVLLGHDHLKLVTAELSRAGVIVALFIEPSLEAIEASRSIGVPAIEAFIRAPGAMPWIMARSSVLRREFVRLKAAARRCAELGIECHAGHGLDYETAAKISALPQVVELNIGHFLVGEAIFVGLEAAIRKMRAAMDAGRAAAQF